MSDVATDPISSSRDSWFGTRPALVLEVGLLAIVYGSIGPMFPLSDGARDLNDAISGNWLWLILAFLVSSGLCAVTAYFAVRLQLSRIKNFTNLPTLNRMFEGVYRLFFWALPAFGLGCLVAILLCLLGVYSVRPYPIMAVAAAAYFTGGLVGIRTLATMDSALSLPPSSAIDRHTHHPEQ